MITHETSFDDDDTRDIYSTPKDTKNKAKLPEIIKIGYLLQIAATNAREKNSEETYYSKHEDHQGSKY